jgi:hypothetical protein
VLLVQLNLLKLGWLSGNGVDCRVHPPQPVDMCLLAPVVQTAQQEYVESSRSGGCSIQSFQKRYSFTSVSFDEKVRIIEKGRPAPDLHIDTKSKGKKLLLGISDRTFTKRSVVMRL